MLRSAKWGYKKAKTLFYIKNLFLRQSGNLLSRQFSKFWAESTDLVKAKYKKLSFSGKL